jgi:hypothetical protein
MDVFFMIIGVVGFWFWSNREQDEDGGLHEDEAVMPYSKEVNSSTEIYIEHDHDASQEWAESNIERKDSLEMSKKNTPVDF